MAHVGSSIILTLDFESEASDTKKRGLCRLESGKGILNAVVLSSL